MSKRCRQSDVVLLPKNKINKKNDDNGSITTTDVKVLENKILNSVKQGLIPNFHDVIISESLSSFENCVKSSRINFNATLKSPDKQFLKNEINCLSEILYRKDPNFIDIINELINNKFKMSNVYNIMGYTFGFYFINCYNIETFALGGLFSFSKYGGNINEVKNVTNISIIRLPEIKYKDQSFFSEIHIKIEDKEIFKFDFIRQLPYGYDKFMYKENGEYVFTIKHTNNLINNGDNKAYITPKHGDIIILGKIKTDDKAILKKYESNIISIVNNTFDKFLGINFDYKLLIDELKSIKLKTL